MAHTLSLFPASVNRLSSLWYRYSAFRDPYPRHCVAASPAIYPRIIASALFQTHICHTLASSRNELTAQSG